MLAQGEDIVPIPGTKRIKYLDENIAATEIDLSRDELDALGHAVELGAAARHGEARG